MTKKNFLRLLFLPIVTFFLFYSIAEARPRLEPVYNPGTIKVKGMSEGKIKKAIKKALFGRNWQFKEIQSGLIRATYAKSSRRTSLKAVVNIHYTGSMIRIHYYKSEGFSYNKAAGTINAKYNSWVKNIERDIRYNVGAF